MSPKGREHKITVRELWTAIAQWPFMNDLQKGVWPKKNKKGYKCAFEENTNEHSSLTTKDNSLTALCNIFYMILLSSSVNSCAKYFQIFFLAITSVSLISQ